MASRRRRPSLLLFPGAGTSADHPGLVAIERAVAPGACRRVDFPYRLAGRRAPDRAPVLLQAVRDAIAAAPAGPLVLGGRSMGGRMCSMVAAGVDGLAPPDGLRGLVLVCYPLHPPGKPANLRVEHLPDIRVPCLFVSGTRDAFGTPDELTSWTATIPAPVEHVWIDGAGHDLRGADDRVAQAVAGWIAQLPAPSVAPVTPARSTRSRPPG